VNRWQRRIDDFDGIRTGDIVKVQMGGGMEKAKVISRNHDHITVGFGKRTIAVWDARSLKPG